MPTFTVGVPIVYRNTEYVEVEAADEAGAILVAVARIEPAISIAQALGQDSGLYRTLIDQAFIVQEEDHDD